jgi:hypothetical protein
MELTLRRHPSSSKSTLGELYIANRFLMWTLEDVIREYPKKVPKQTAIWGNKTYRVVNDYSPKFGRKMLHVTDVELFEGIRIHSGNDAEDTEGCILVGFLVEDNDSVLHSRIALKALEKIVVPLLEKGEEILLTIINPTTQGEVQ